MKTIFLTLVLLSLTGCGEPQAIRQGSFRFNNRRPPERHQRRMSKLRRGSLARLLKSLTVTRFSCSNPNLDKPFRKIIEVAGLVPRPKLFQNMRARCETQWLKDGERADLVANWIGHSVTVSRFSGKATFSTPPRTWTPSIQNRRSKVATQSRETVRKWQPALPVKTLLNSVFPRRTRVHRLTRPGLEPELTEPKTVVLPITLPG